MKLAFVDTETTGLDSERHEVWDIAIIQRWISPSTQRVVDTEHTWTFWPQDMSTADPTALRLNKFYERTFNVRESFFTSTEARVIARLLDGATFIGAVPDFDARFLDKLLRKYGAAPAWHYHLVDVENLMVGALAARGEPLAPPWDSHYLSDRIGVTQDEDSKHTAMGDARWARDCYDAVMSGRIH